MIAIQNISGCPSQFSSAKQLYCHEKCETTWRKNTIGCNQADADAFCKLKLCDQHAKSTAYDITMPWKQPGFSCSGKGSSYGKWFGMENVHYSKSIVSEFEGKENAVVSNVQCELSATKS